MNHVFELIPLTIEARGEVITNNVAEFRQLVRNALEGINSSPSTDEEFGQADLDSKALKAAEDRIIEAKDKALADAADLYKLLKELDETSEEIRSCRLTLEKAVAKRKEEVKSELIADAMNRLECAPRLRQSTYGRSVADAIKGKKNLDSMKRGLDQMVAIHNAAILKNREAISTFERAHGQEMTMDRDDLETKSPDSVEVELRRRFEAKKAADERRRLEADAAVAKADAARIAAEAKATAENPVQSADPRNPHNLPPPPKIDVIPVGRVESETAAEEMSRFIATLIACFAPVKEARANLKHEQNIAAASKFAGALGNAWAELNGRKESAA